MANTNNAFGFSPIHGNEGGPPPINYYKAAVANIFRGDVVEINSSGQVIALAADAGSAKILGVAAHHITGADSAAVQDLAVYDDPDQVYKVQDDGSATPNQNMAGGTCDINRGAGNATTKQSAYALKLSAVGTSATSPTIIRGFVSYPNVDNTLVYALWLIQLNLHLFSKGNAGV